jgi:uncharacterized membrane protein YfcA
LNHSNFIARLNAADCAGSGQYAEVRPVQVIRVGADNGGGPAAVGAFSVRNHFWRKEVGMLFQTSGIEVAPWIPPLVAFVISFFTSMGGVSGAFLLLPFQVSVLGYTAPSVSGTNQVFNIVAIPSGVYRYIREGRMLWPLTWAVIIGTLPGVFIGAWVRIKYLPDPKNFKLFVGMVLCYIGFRLLMDVIKNKSQKKETNATQKAGNRHTVRLLESTIRQVEFNYDGETHKFSPPVVYVICFLVGIIGGIYGIGGGSIVAPFFVAIIGLPVYTVAGAALMGTFVTSVAGVVFYQYLSWIYTDMAVAPDWALGVLFGFGGLFGMYLGARTQKFVPARVIKSILCACVLFVAFRYIIGFFR